MNIKSIFAAAALLGAAMNLAPMTAMAGAGDFVFEAVDPQVRSGDDREVAVRLVHKPDGKLVPGAVIFQTRLDMAPDKMADMTAKIEPLPSTEPGVYRFRCDFTMAGRWQMTLAAKIQGEAETVKGSVIFTAKD